MFSPQAKYGMTYKEVAGSLVSKHDLVTFGNEILSCGNNLLTCVSNLLSCGNDLLSCGNNFLSCANDFLSHDNKIKKIIGKQYYVPSRDL